MLLKVYKNNELINKLEGELTLGGVFVTEDGDEVESWADAMNLLYNDEGSILDGFYNSWQEASDEISALEKEKWTVEELKEIIPAYHISEEINGKLVIEE